MRGGPAQLNGARRNIQFFMYLTFAVIRMAVQFSQEVVYNLEFRPSTAVVYVTRTTHVRYAYLIRG